MAKEDKNNQERLIVRPYNPRRERQKLLLAVAMVALSLIVGLLLGGQWFGHEMKQRRQLAIDLQTRDKQLAETQQQLATAELAAEVDRNALESVRLQLSELQGELASNEEELSFYRNLLQEGGAATGLVISGLTLTQGDDGVLNYRLVVQQRAGKLKTIKVTTVLEVEGTQDGEHKTLTLGDVDPEQNDYYMYLTFRYFYVHDGTVSLPDGFEPNQITVKVWPAGQNKQAVSRQFEWKLEEV